METAAREIFRDVLAAHYIDGHPFGEEADLWLKIHGGWLPDPQEMYDDGTPLTQPRDEGDRVMSKYPEKALKEAMGLMKASQSATTSTCTVTCNSELMNGSLNMPKSTALRAYTDARMIGVEQIDITGAALIHIN